MREEILRNRIGRLMIVSHFSVILLIVYFRLVDKFDDDTLKVALPVVIPLFASYTTIIVNNFIENRHKAGSKKMVNSNFVFVCFFITALLTLFVFAVVIKQSVKPASIESFAVLLGLSETVFGLYVGYIIKALFQSQTPQPAKNPTAMTTVNPQQVQ